MEISEEIDAINFSIEEMHDTRSAGSNALHLNTSSLDEFLANLPLPYKKRKYNGTATDLDDALADELPSMDAVSVNMQIFIIIMYSLTAVLSLVGNTSVIVVLVFGKRWVKYVLFGNNSYYSKKAINNKIEFEKMLLFCFFIMIFNLALKLAKNILNIVLLKFEHQLFFLASSI